MRAGKIGRPRVPGKRIRPGPSRRRRRPVGPETNKPRSGPHETILPRFTPMMLDAGNGTPERAGT